MGRSRSGAALVVAWLGVACLAACSADKGTPTDGPPTPTARAEAPPYETRSFAPALTVTPPSWLPEAPAVDEEHFLTWVGAGVDVDRAVRFLSPVGIFDPGHRPQRLSPVPDDYVTYLLDLTHFGADISSPTTIDVDGRVLLAWARDVTGSPDAESDATAFEQLLGGVRFR